MSSPGSSPRSCSACPCASRSRRMTAGRSCGPASRSPMPERLPTSAAPPVALERRHWLAAVAMFVVLFAPYQTLVQTVTTDDAVRKGIEADDYQMTWVQVGYGV